MTSLRAALERALLSPVHRRFHGLRRRLAVFAIAPPLQLVPSPISRRSTRVPAPCRPDPSLRATNGVLSAAHIETRLTCPGRLQRIRSRKARSGSHPDTPSPRCGNRSESLAEIAGGSSGALSGVAQKRMRCRTCSAVRNMLSLGIPMDADVLYDQSPKVPRWLTQKTGWRLAPMHCPCCPAHCDALRPASV